MPNTGAYVFLPISTLFFNIYANDSTSETAIYSISGISSPNGISDNSFTSSGFSLMGTSCSLATAMIRCAISSTPMAVMRGEAVCSPARAIA